MHSALSTGLVEQLRTSCPSVKDQTDNVVLQLTNLKNAVSHLQSSESCLSKIGPDGRWVRQHVPLKDSSQELSKQQSKQPAPAPTPIVLDGDEKEMSSSAIQRALAQALQSAGLVSGAASSSSAPLPATFSECCKLKSMVVPQLVCSWNVRGKESKGGPFFRHTHYLLLATYDLRLTCAATSVGDAAQAVNTHSYRCRHFLKDEHRSDKHTMSVNQKEFKCQFDVSALENDMSDSKKNTQDGVPYCAKLLRSNKTGAEADVSASANRHST